jgi:hypothetical protein
MRRQALLNRSAREAMRAPFFLPSTFPRTSSFLLLNSYFLLFSEGRNDLRSFRTTESNELARSTGNLNREKMIFLIGLLPFSFLQGRTTGASQDNPTKILSA